MTIVPVAVALAVVIGSTGVIFWLARSAGSAPTAGQDRLERYLAGDLKGAAAALKKARKANGFVELYLTGQKPIPKEMPGMYSPGSEEEAILCMDMLAAAWVEHKDALFWLLDNCRGKESNILPMTSAGKKAPGAGKKLQ